MSELKKHAPDGQIWLCGACGKRDKNKYKVGDESCYLYSVLVYEASIREAGGVLKADAVNAPEAESGS